MPRRHLERGAGAAAADARDRRGDVRLLGRCVQRGAKARQGADCSLSHAHVDCQVLGEDRYVARWPALLTGRAPRSAQGSHNLRLAGRLLVDFLDKVEFKERCRCCVEKSNATAYQSDEEARSMLTKLKKKNKSKGEVRLKNLKNLALPNELLSMCDAQEDFPEFEEGTLCVQLKTNCTRPTAEVRKEMGEEVWKRGAAELDAIKAELLASPKVHFSDVLRLEETGEEAFGLTPHCTIMNTASRSRSLPQLSS
ncbi:hypothetical protein PInf_009860 [Phytophthora infestans]|nr:hypothetical protein PInf_009860 [Phytophthora infestans]